MNSREQGHLSDAVLLRYADGELPAGEAKRVRTHLASCWRCSTELAEIQQTIQKYVRYQEAVRQGHLPEPPAPWFDIYRKFGQIDEASPGPAWWRRLGGGLRALAGGPRRWVPATAVLAATLLVVNQLGNAPSVKAAELLRKAAAAEQAQPPGRRHIEFRTASATLTRVVGAQGSADWEAEAALATLRPLFEQAHYDWRDPLSAVSFARWRNSLAEKRDEVMTVRDRFVPGRKCYRIRTTTNSSVLVEAILNLTVAELRPVEGTMRFRDNQWVQMRELAAAEIPAPVAELPRRPAAPATVKPATTGEPASREIIEPATPAEELMVLAVLHELGADLGEPVEVSREGDRIAVSGYGVSPEIAARIQQQLAGVPGVVVRLGDAPAGTLDAGTSAGREAAVEVNPLQEAIVERLGGPTAFEQFSEGLLGINEELMARAYALHRLAQHFPPGKEAQLAPEDRRLLAKLRRDHAVPLAGLAAALEEQVRPALEGLGPAPGAAAGLPAASWQEATEVLVNTARRTDYLTAVLLGGAAPEKGVEETAAEALTATAQLRLQAAEYLRYAVE